MSRPILRQSLLCQATEKCTFLSFFDAFINLLNSPTEIVFTVLRTEIKNIVRHNACKL